MRTKQTIIQRITDILDKYPKINYNIKNNQELAIYTNTTNGLDITLIIGEDENTIYLGGFHTHYENDAEETEVLYQLLICALTGKVRIKELSKGEKTYKYILQSKNEMNQWADYERVVALFFKFWKRTSVRYLQNNFLIKE